MYSVAYCSGLVLGVFFRRQNYVSELLRAACPFFPEHASNTNPSILRLESSSMPNRCTRLSSYHTLAMLISVNAVPIQSRITLMSYSLSTKKWRMDDPGHD